MNTETLSNLKTSAAILIDTKQTPAARIDAAKQILTADRPPMLAPLSEGELAEYNRLTTMINDVELRRTSIAQLRHGRRRSPAHLELLDDRDRELFARGAALMRIRAPLYLRFKHAAPCDSYR